MNIGSAAGCLLQEPGDPYPGEVACVDLNAQGAIENSYSFVFGLDETYNGRWIDATTEAEIPMKGFRTASKDGNTRAVPASAGSLRVAADRASSAEPGAPSASSAFADRVTRAIRAAQDAR